MNRLFREGVEAGHFNRFKLGRALDDCHAYGCDSLFAQLSMIACKQENIDRRFNHLDTTTFSLTGDYYEDSDEHTIEITYGYSKDHRPDLKQAVLELMTSQDGGVPIISRAWNGNSSDSKIFRERAKELVKSFKEADEPRYLIADSKLYDKETAKEALSFIPFITRIPGTIDQEKEIIQKACQESKWENSEEDFFVEYDVEH